MGKGKQGPVGVVSARHGPPGGNAGGVGGVRTPTMVSSYRWYRSGVARCQQGNGVSSNKRVKPPVAVRIRPRQVLKVVFGNPANTAVTGGSGSARLPGTTSAAGQWHTTGGRVRQKVGRHEGEGGKQRPPAIT